MRIYRKLTAKKEKKKKVQPFPEVPTVIKRIVNQLDNLIEFVPVSRLSRNLRDLFLLYLANVEDGLVAGFDEFPTDFYFLLQFLDTIEEEMALQGMNNR